MMSCELNPHILEYIELVENGIACEEQKALAAHVRKCFETEEIYVDTEQLEKYLGLAKYFSFVPMGGGSDCPLGLHLLEIQQPPQMETCVCHGGAWRREGWLYCL